MRIDLHTHFIPAEFIEQVRQGRAIGNVAIQPRDGQEWLIHQEGYRYPAMAELWSVEAKLQLMDHLGIDISVLSLQPALFFYWLEAGPVQEFCRQTNEALAEMVSRSGGRLYGLATVPLQDPAAAAIELRRAVLELGLRGVQVGTRMEQIPLDDPRFDPFFATAADLNVPVLLHPYRVGTRPEWADFYLANLIGNPLETCLVASRLIFSGWLDRHPQLTLILAHGGGFLPYQIGRLDHGFRVRAETKLHLSSPPSSYLRRFYYDTITHAAAPLKFLVELVGADRVVLGTDIPFDMADHHFADYLAAAKLDEQSIQTICSQNALRILGLDNSLT
jgi:aminocarboxymuconate-semialdehyde decarboxylase